MHIYLQSIRKNTANMNQLQLQKQNKRFTMILRLRNPSYSRRSKSSSFHSRYLRHGHG